MLFIQSHAELTERSFVTVCCVCSGAALSFKDKAGV